PEQRLPEKAAADSRHDLIVFRGRRRFARDFPQDAAAERIAQRFPETKPRGAGESVVHRSLVGMAELVDGEAIAVDDPWAAQVALDRREARIEIAAAEYGSIGEIQERVEAHDLERRNQITLVSTPGLDRRVRCGRWRRRSAGGGLLLGAPQCGQVRL